MNRMIVLPVVLPLLLATACGSGDGDDTDEQQRSAEESHEATALWVASLSADEVYRLDLATDELRSVGAIDSAATLAVTSDAAWIDGYDGVRIGDDLAVEDLDLEDSIGDAVDSVGASGDQVWFAVDDPSAAVVAYDPESGELRGADRARHRGLQPRPDHRCGRRAVPGERLGQLAGPGGHRVR